MTNHTTRDDQLEFQFPPIKLCECGCGQPAPIAKQTDPRRGSVAGEASHFVKGHYAYVQPTSSPEKRFWNKVDKSGGNDTCWIWTGATNKKGYGFFRHKNRRNMQTHRYSWELHNGPIPDGMLVCHHCDNPPCVNPAHLWIGTNDDNMNDMIAKGRANHPGLPGESNPRSRLTESDVLVIRKRRKEGESCASIGKDYSMKSGAISQITRRVTWKHLP